MIAVSSSLHRQNSSVSMYTNRTVVQQVTSRQEPIYTRKFHSTRTAVPRLLVSRRQGSAADGSVFHGKEPPPSSRVATREARPTEFFERLRWLLWGLLGLFIRSFKFPRTCRAIGSPCAMKKSFREWAVAAAKEKAVRRHGIYFLLYFPRVKRDAGILILTRRSAHVPPHSRRGECLRGSRRENGGASEWRFVSQPTRYEILTVYAIRRDEPGAFVLFRIGRRGHFSKRVFTRGERRAEDLRNRRPDSQQPPVARGEESFCSTAAHKTSCPIRRSSVHN